MTKEEAIAIIENEKKCINRASDINCNRDCYNCDLVKTDTEILEALDMAIKALKQTEPERKPGKWICEQPWSLPKCSICGMISLFTNYCPNCGAKMEVN